MLWNAVDFPNHQINLACRHNTPTDPTHPLGNTKKKKTDFFFFKAI